MLETKQRAETLAEIPYLPIEAYGMIGDLTTVAQVGKNGSIDWKGAFEDSKRTGGKG
ncbi:MAG TPA: hypothetical protein VF043_26000 [Ktedonobacteraceae bacterium]